ncbi:unnamed protein product [Closterium sp. NIES-65]|nr:unnamed protein product [Closterium sp. NIES-65]
MLLPYPASQLPPLILSPQAPHQPPLAASAPTPAVPLTSSFPFSSPHFPRQFPPFPLPTHSPQAPHQPPLAASAPMLPPRPPHTSFLIPLLHMRPNTTPPPALTTSPTSATTRSVSCDAALPPQAPTPPLFSSPPFTLPPNGHFPPLPSPFNSPRAPRQPPLAVSTPTLPPRLATRRRGALLDAAGNHIPVNPPSLNSTHPYAPSHPSPCLLVRPITVVPHLLVPSQGAGGPCWTQQATHHLPTKSPIRPPSPTPHLIFWGAHPCGSQWCLHRAQVPIDQSPPMFPMSPIPHPPLTLSSGVLITVVPNGAFTGRRWALLEAGSSYTLI